LKKKGGEPNGRVHGSGMEFESGVKMPTQTRLSISEKKGTEEGEEGVGQENLGGIYPSWVVGLGFESTRVTTKEE